MILSILLYLIVFILGACALALLVTYFYFKRKYKYWGARNVPHAEPIFPFGNLKTARKEHIGVIMKKLYQESRDQRYYGIWLLNSPTLIINDLELIKKVLTTDFNHFHDHGAYYDEKNDPFSANLFTFEGDRWKIERKKVSPAFSPSKMKMIFPIIIKCCQDLVNVLKESAVKGEEILVKDISRRFTIDVISLSAFGIEANSLENPDSMMRKMGEKVVDPSWDIAIKLVISYFVPNMARFFKVRVVSKQVMDFFHKAVRRTVKYRQKNNIKKNDILELMIQLKNEGYIRDEENFNENEEDLGSFSLEQIASQAFLFLGAGFETSSSVMHFLLYELAKNKDIQYRLRKEIKNVMTKRNGRISFEAVNETEYLGRIIDETLRKYPPGFAIFRICTKDYKIPDSNVTIEKGTKIVISVFGIHHDEKYYPEPGKFDPDRFAQEQKASRDHYTFLPFGEGPRICIGQRFALLELRAVLFTILSEFEVAVSDNTPAEIEYDPRSFIPSSKECIKLKLIPLEDQNVIYRE